MLSEILSSTPFAIVWCVAFVVVLMRAIQLRATRHTNTAASPNTTSTTPVQSPKPLCATVTATNVLNSRRRQFIFHDIQNTPHVVERLLQCIAAIEHCTTSQIEPTMKSEEMNRVDVDTLVGSQSPGSDPYDHEKQVNCEWKHYAFAYKTTRLQASS